MTVITAQCILASRHIHRPEKPLFTLLWTYPRWIHAEGRTHRLLRMGEEVGAEIALEPRTPSPMEDPNLSRNASSSRAIPVAKLIDDVMLRPAIPLYWGSNKPGMQAGEELQFEERKAAIRWWTDGLQAAVDHAREGMKHNAHKQIINRILEPYSHITVVVSGTEWDNFFDLRDHHMAEPHIAMLARETRKAMDAAEIRTLNPGQWHAPFVSDDEWQMYGADVARKISAARCASTSYKTVDGFDMTPERAILLTDKLVADRPMHASPLEHVALADDYHESGFAGSGWAHPGEHRNYVGFRQWRAMVGG